MFKKELDNTDMLSETSGCTNGSSGFSYLSSIVDLLSSGIICIDHQCIVRYLNSEASRLSGFDGATVVGHNLYDILPDLAEYENAVKDVLRRNRVEVFERISFKSDRSRIFDLRVIIFEMENSPGALIKIEDVTESVKKDEHLRQAQKMDSVGSLAAGLAHDFNNIIGGITATVSSIQFSLEMSDASEELKNEIKEDLEIIEESTKKGSGLIEQLLSLSRKEELEYSVVDLNELVADVVKICAHTLAESIETKVSCADGAALVMAYPSQLEQAVLNLCVNASHAMTFMRGDDESNYGGILRVSVEKIAVGKNMASTFPDAHEGNYWMLGISDTGVGMDSATQKKIFEPFFSTKEKGRGTGLGLSVVFNIIRKHHGFIEVYSEPGVGTSFMVFIPEYNGKADSDRNVLGE